MCTMGLFWKRYRFFHWLLSRSCAQNWVRIGNLHDDVHWIDYYHQNPSGFFSLMQIRAIVIFLAGIVQFKYERKSKMDSCTSSKMTLSCEWPIECFHMKSRRP